MNSYIGKIMLFTVLGSARVLSQDFKAHLELQNSGEYLKTATEVTIDAYTPEGKVRMRADAVATDSEGKHECKIIKQNDSIN